jgi:hypothetical protein
LEPGKAILLDKFWAKWFNGYSSHNLKDQRALGQGIPAGHGLRGIAQGRGDFEKRDISMEKLERLIVTGKNEEV